MFSIEYSIWRKGRAGEVHPSMSTGGVLKFVASVRSTVLPPVADICVCVWRFLSPCPLGGPVAISHGIYLMFGSKTWLFSLGAI